MFVDINRFNTMDAKRKRITLKDVAQKSGFAVTTVSFVLNEAPLASRLAEDTKERIRRAADELGYHPNHLARALRNQQSRTIGVVVFDISDPYCSQIVTGVEEAFYQSSSYLPIVVDVRNDRSRFRRFLKLLLERQVEGLIVMGNSIYPEGDLLKTMEQCRVPVVMIGREFLRNPVSTVTGDNERGAVAMMKHLHSLGHRQIAYIRGPRAFIDSAQRWKGIESFTHESGLVLDPKLVTELSLHNAGHQGGYELTRKLIRQGEKFSALMAHDDLTAFGAIRALLENGRKVPEDCSVTGFDDVPTSAYYNPPLTTIHQDMEGQGRIGVGVLLDILKAPGRGLQATPSHHRVTPQLVVRGSTAPPRK